MDFIDLKKQQKLIRKNIDDRISKVLNHGQYILGPEVKELEKQEEEAPIEVKAEVVGFEDERLLLMPLGNIRGIKATDRIRLTNKTFTIPF